MTYFRERRETLLNVLDFMTEEELLAPMPEGFPFLVAPCIAQLFSHAAFHEGLHSGQFSVAHRAMGHSPLFQLARKTDRRYSVTFRDASAR